MPETKEKTPNQPAAAQDSDLESLPADETLDYGEILADWHFAETPTHERGKLWYIIFIIIVAALLIFSYLSKNPLFAIIVVLGLIVYVITEKRGPTVFHLVVTEDGLLINEKFTGYDELESFYIVYYPPQIKNLYIQPKNGFKQPLTIHLGDQNPVAIRNILLNFIREDLAKEEMPLSDGLIHRLKL